MILEYKYLCTKCGNSKLEGIVILGVLVFIAKMNSTPNLPLYPFTLPPVLSPLPGTLASPSYNYHFQFRSFYRQKYLLHCFNCFILFDFYCVWTSSHVNLPIILHQIAYSLRILVCLVRCSFSSHWFVRFLYKCC